ncbi:ABC transporter ATP-binding protein/permease [Sedimentibacter sp. zth1]|uniref:ABC transporter ATP-binding protein/permease n=1 Tax=Sedimentibacter sp. zth1 TaxID=2816908 RepID=UPI001A92DED3|nr:ABC transporter ATP-binding protein/permease [Sedimentibacter sp. zth1]QSX05752.1 ABC transporter ATP-binding protein/permease [Sedimentibacter sp. zth1]
MIKLSSIRKEYTIADTKVQALKGINIEFRQNEFVSIVGPSGCGKTTLLNIIGGLDHYTDGDLSIEGRSTKDFKENDWDSYRNHSVGFVFQSYNLIPHQTVLSNVELALTLSGVSKSERKKRATDVLRKVGLGDQLKKKPNQMSGGQMQRVAIARALVNNPEILLADEPTGALDSETSIQIMDLLKGIANDRLVIMVTHNPELAENYSTRIIKLLDGNIINDTSPYEENKLTENKVTKKERKPSMSLKTALSLSFNNLLSKKARTFLTAFAGSIGIIGIALIMSLQTGVQNYISTVEEDTLASYPITIASQSMDMSSMMSMMMKTSEKEGHDLEKIYSNNIMTNMLKSLTTQAQKNDLAAFKKYIENENNSIYDITNDVKYGYDLALQIFNSNYDKEIIQVNPSTLLDDIGFSTPMPPMVNMGLMPKEAFPSPSNINVFDEMLDNKDLLHSQYDVLAGKWPENYDELVMVIDENNEINDMTLYSLGLMNQQEVKDMMNSIREGKEIESTTEITSYTYENILNTSFKLLLNTDYFNKDKNGQWKNNSNNTIYMTGKLDTATDLKIVGIVRPNENAISTSISGTIGYTKDLTEFTINKINESEIVKEQLANPNTDIFTGINFDDNEIPITMDDVNMYISTLPQEEQMQIQMMVQTKSEEEILNIFAKQMGFDLTNATYEGNLSLLGSVSLDNPSTINIYPNSFENKDAVINYINDYNKIRTEASQEEYRIGYTDVVGIMMSAVTTIVNTISYVLIAFVAISLIVSSIMIGIITYISVLERTKEIGVLRSIGASKRDISTVFNAETLIVGFIAGLIGIGITLLLSIPINNIVYKITNVANISALPVMGAVILILISVILTVIAGLIPSRIAAKKDPVIALRSE